MALCWTVWISPHVPLSANIALRRIYIERAKSPIFFSDACSESHHDHRFAPITSLHKGTAFARLQLVGEACEIELKEDTTIAKYSCRNKVGTILISPNGHRIPTYSSNKLYIHVQTIDQR